MHGRSKERESEGLGVLAGREWVCSQKVSRVKKGWSSVSVVCSLLLYSMNWGK